MKSLLKLSLATLLSLPLISHAALFNFSYEFQAGYGDDRGIEPTLITGSFNGTQDGLFVKNISNIRANLQGREFAQPLIAIRYDPVIGDPFTPEEGIFSFDVMLNNFMIIDDTYFTERYHTNEFSILNYQNMEWGFSELSRVAINDNGGYSYGIDIDSSTNTSWRLTLVPEPAGWLLMASGLALLPRRRHAQK